MDRISPDLDREGTASDACYGAVRRDIVRGVLPPLARLRLEKLSEAYGASVSTLREVLSRLAGERFVVAEGQRGFTVAPVTYEEFRDLASLRALLEIHAMRRSFDVGDLDWEGGVVGAHHKLHRMEERMLAGDASAADTWKHYDKEFHNRLIAACGSTELLSAHATVFDRYLRYQMVAVIFRGAEAVEEHAALRDCALARDAEGAARILSRHIGACVEDTAARGRLQAGGAVAPVAPERDTVSTAVWRRVRDDILNGTLQPSRKLKLERLKEAYGASVGTLREVLARLVTEGLVLAEGQRGFEVAAVSADNLRELAELRLLVESRALADSLRNGDVDWEARVVAAHHKLAALEERMDRGDRSDVDLWKRQDWSFHQTLISACGSDVLMHLHGGIFEKYLRYQRLALSFRGEIAAGEHRALRDAALARDGNAAAAILATHLRGGVDHALASGTIASRPVSRIDAVGKEAGA